MGAHSERRKESEHTQRGSVSCEHCPGGTTPGVHGPGTTFRECSGKESCHERAREAHLSPPGARGPSTEVRHRSQWSSVLSVWPPEAAGGGVLPGCDIVEKCSRFRRCDVGLTRHTRQRGMSGKVPNTSLTLYSRADKVRPCVTGQTRVQDNVRQPLHTLHSYSVRGPQ